MGIAAVYVPSARGQQKWEGYAESQKKLPKSKPRAVSSLRQVHGATQGYWKQGKRKDGEADAVARW